MKKPIRKAKSGQGIGARIRQQKAKAQRSRKTRIERVLEHLDGVERRSDGYVALCPAHPDNNPSLSIRQDGNTVLIHCHAGCEPKAIIKAAGLTWKDLGTVRKLVASYQYRDERGKLRFTVNRYEEGGKKDFRRTPRGAEDILYNLPALTKAKKTVPVYLVEGEKDADNLIKLGLVATTTPCGAGAWKPSYNRYFTDRPVIILPDNDDPGLESAQRRADMIGCVAESVKVLLLPDLQYKGDASDWLDNGGTKAKLAALVKKTKGWVPGRTKWQSSRVAEWQKPIEVPPFPSDVFPDPLGNLIRTGAESFPCPPDMIGVMLISVLGTAIGKTYSLEVKPGYVQGPRIYSACVATPGDRKSPVLEMVSAPLYAIQRELEAKYEDQLEEYKQRKKKDEEFDGPKPTPMQIISTDATTEAIAVLVNENPRGVLSEQDELSGWARGMGQYKGSRGNDRQKWLSIWSGKTEVINRKGHPPLYLYNPLLNVTGCIQPDMLGELVDRQGREDGFLHRVLLAYPNAIAQQWTETAINSKLAKEYETIVRKLWGKVDNTSQFTSQKLSLSPSGKTEFVKWINAHHAQQNALNGSLRGVWSKLEAYCIRLALILHRVRYVTKDTRSRDVDAESVKRSGTLIEYFKGHAKRVYARMRQDGDTTRLGHVAKWIRSKGGTVTTKDLVTYKVANVDDADKAKALIDDLQAAGFGQRINGVPQANSVSFTLTNP